MTEEMLAEHNCVFQEAMAIVEGQIPLCGQVGMLVPGWLLRRKLKRAVVLFERALQINPENWSAMWFIGKVYQRFRNMSEALLWFERSYQINPSHPDIAREASLCAMEMGCHDVAIVFAHRATQIDSTNAGLRANLALAHLLAGRVLDAREAIERALMADPSDAASQTIQMMIQHFTANGRVPPETTPALLNYWRQIG